MAFKKTTNELGNIFTHNPNLYSEKVKDQNLDLMIMGGFQDEKLSSKNPWLRRTRDFFTGILPLVMAIGGCQPPGNTSPNPNPTPDNNYSLSFVVRDALTSQEIPGQTIKVKDAKGNVTDAANGQNLNVVNDIKDVDIPTLESHLKGYIIIRTGSKNLDGELVYFEDQAGPHRKDYWNNPLASLSNEMVLHAYVIPKKWANKINPESGLPNIVTLASQLGEGNTDYLDGRNIRYDKLRDPDNTTVDFQGNVLYYLNDSAKSEFIKSRDLKEAKDIDEFLGPDGYPVFHKNNRTGEIKWFGDDKTKQRILNNEYGTLTDYLTYEEGVTIEGVPFKQAREDMKLASINSGNTVVNADNASNSKIQVIPFGIWEYLPQETDVRAFISEARKRINNSNLGIYLQAPKEVKTNIKDGLTTIICESGNGVRLDIENYVVVSSQALAYYKNRVLGGLMAEMHSGLTGQVGDGNLVYNAWLRTDSNATYVPGFSEAARIGNFLPKLFDLDEYKLLDGNTI